MHRPLRSRIRRSAQSPLAPAVGLPALASVVALLVLLAPAAVESQSLPPQTALQAPKTERYTFTLRKPDAPDTPLYIAARDVVTEGGRVTERTVFSDAVGRPIQRTVAVYEEASLAPVSWHLEDLRSGELEAMSREGGTVKMLYKEKTGEDPDQGSVDYQPGMLFSPTVTPFIKRNLERLRAGETVPFKLLVPSRQDVFSFRVLLDTERRFDVPGLVIRMDPATWFIRQLVDPLYFVLDVRPPHETLIFQGRSSVKADDGDDQDLRYDFR